MFLSPREVADYDRDGYVLVPDLFSEQEVAALQRRDCSIVYGLCPLPQATGAAIQRMTAVLRIR